MTIISPYLDKCRWKSFVLFHRCELCRLANTFFVLLCAWFSLNSFVKPCIMHDTHSFGPLPAPPLHLCARPCLLCLAAVQGCAHRALLFVCPPVCWAPVPGLGKASLEHSSWGAAALWEGSRCQNCPTASALSLQDKAKAPSRPVTRSGMPSHPPKTCPCCVEHLSLGIMAVERADCVGLRCGWVWPLHLLQQHHDSYHHLRSPPKFIHFLQS